MYKYNLGYGKDFKTGWVNLDKNDIDLNSYFDLDDKADYILASHVIEHLDDMFKFLISCNSNMNDGAIIEIRVPTVNYNIFHKKEVFTFDYFKNVCTDDDKRSMEKVKLFDMIEQKGRIRLKKKYYRIKKWFLNIIFDEWIIKLKKIDLR